MASPAEIEQSCKRFARRWVIGDAELHPKFTGVRREKPHGRIVGKTEEYASQQPLPELDGMEVLDAEDNPAVTADVVSLESIGVTRAGNTILLEFFYCIDYPPQLLGRPPGRRVVLAPHDPRLWMWTIECLEVLYASLGDDAATVEFEVEVVTDTFEALAAAEKTLPG